MKPSPGSGDRGDTNVLGNRRVPKSSPVIEALGAIDEASSAIGAARALSSKATNELLYSCQLTLQKCATEIAIDERDEGTDFDFAAAAADLEKETLAIGANTFTPTAFVVPGSTSAEAALHQARSVVRRAERRVFGLEPGEFTAPPGVAVYLNRLSDLLFELASIAAGKPEKPS